MNMLRNVPASFVIVCLVVLTAPIATAQQAQQGAPVPIVVVDLSKVFEQHPTFKSEMERIKLAVKTSEVGFQKQGEQIKLRVQQLQDLKPSSPDFKTLESDTARMQGQIQAEMALKRKEFLEMEAKAYYGTYQQVKQEIKTFAENHRIGLVLRFSSETIDPANRQSVMQGVNQPIVYNQGNLDITKYIVDQLHRAAGGQTARAPKAGAQKR